MFAFDRETATIVAIVVCIAASAYLFNELKKTKSDVEGFKNALVEKQQPVMFMGRPPMAPVPEPEVEPVQAAVAETPTPTPVKPMTTRKKAVAEKESSE